MYNLHILHSLDQRRGIERNSSEDRHVDIYSTVGLTVNSGLRDEEHVSLFPKAIK